MKVFGNQFEIPYQNLIGYIKSKYSFDDFDEGFAEDVVEFPFDIGYCGTYTGGENNKEITRTNKCLVSVEQDSEKPNDYYIMAMFPVEYLI